MGNDSARRYGHHMLIGYGRVSTAEQNADHQVDALTRAGALSATSVVAGSSPCPFSSSEHVP